MDLVTSSFRDSFLTRIKWEIGLLALAQEKEYDIVILNGRVTDPEANFDGVRNVGIKVGKIDKNTIK